MFYGCLSVRLLIIIEINLITIIIPIRIIIMIARLAQKPVGLLVAACGRFGSSRRRPKEAHSASSRVLNVFVCPDGEIYIRGGRGGLVIYDVL